jgi:two-component system sensor histidine kinase UhpB
MRILALAQVAFALGAAIAAVLAPLAVFAGWGGPSVPGGEAPRARPAGAVAMAVGMFARAAARLVRRGRPAAAEETPPAAPPPGAPADFAPLARAFELERKYAESEARYRSLIDSLPAIVYEAPVSAEKALIPPALLERFLGYSEAERGQRTTEWWLERIHPDDRPRVFAAWKDALATGFYACEHRLLRSDGRWVWLDSRGRIARLPDGSARMHGLAVDITERREALAALERRTEHLAALSEVALGLARASDGDAVTQEICAALCRLFGYDAAGFHELDERGERFIARVGANVTKEGAEMTSRPVAAMPTLSRALATKQLVECRDLEADMEDAAPEIVAFFQIRSMISAPVFANGRPLGVLTAFTVGRVRVLDEDERALLVALAGVAGGAIARARLLGQVERDRRELRRLGALALAATEAERARVARELHDEAGQSLVALALRLDVLSRSQKLAPDLAREAADLSRVARSTLEELRQLARDLRPAALDDLGLREALQGLARRFGADGPAVSVATPAAPDFPRLAPELETALYRIAQEAVANALRHGAPTHVDVALSLEDGRVRLEVRDDGRGFDASVPRQGIGLASIRERATLVEGEAAIDSAPGAGTRVRVSAPLAAAREGVAS